MQLKQSSVDVSDLVPVLTADGNKRVAEFRNRKASTGQERLELYTTKLVKEQVRQFAELNAVTRGVAAEILLRRGIDAHILETQSAGDGGGLEGSAREEFAADVCPEPDTSDSMPSWTRHIRDAKVKTDYPQQVPVQAFVSGSLVDASTRPAFEPADTMSLPDVVGSPANLMAQCIRDGQPQRKVRTQTTPEPAESKLFQKVMEPKVNSMARWIIEGSPQRMAETLKDRLKTKIKR